MPLKFYTSAKIDNSSNRQTGGISDVSIQDRIIHFLKSNSVQIDPYDGGIILWDELEEFSANIKSVIELIMKEEENWQYSPTQLESYYRRSIAYGSDLLPPRDQVCADLCKLLDVVKMAQEINSDLYFEGD